MFLLAALGCEPAREGLRREVRLTEPVDLAEAEEAVVDGYRARRATLERLANEEDPAVLAGAWGDLAMWCHANGFEADALPAYTRALEIDGTDARWPYLAARLQIRLGDLVAAVEHLDEAVHRSPGSVVLRVVRGETLLAASRLDEAQRAFESLLRELPQGSAAALRSSLGLGRVEFERGRMQRAIELLEPVRRSAPREILHRQPLGLAYRAVGRSDEARALLELPFPESRGDRPVIEVHDPWWSELLSLQAGGQRRMALGRSLLRAGRVDEAVAAFGKALERGGDPTEPRMLLAVALDRSGRTREALEVTEELLHEAPDFARGHLLRGRILLEAGRPAEARPHLERSLELDSGDPRGYRQMVRVLRALGDLDPIEDVARELVRKFPYDPEHHRLLALNLARQGRREEAVKVLETALPLVAPEDRPGLAVLVERLRREVPDGE